VTKIAISEATLTSAGLDPADVAATTRSTDHEIASAQAAAAALRADRLQMARDAYMEWLAKWSNELVRDGNTLQLRPRLSLSTFERAETLALTWFGLIKVDELPQFGPKIYGPLRAKFKSLCRQHFLTDLLKA